ncbi:hypothetical protein [Evansella halocellulosilytica]|uniref:hypothetical protein n=1 Tax=Evansella halocellulosilytica TaxID=2011013 RepID=UPI000BB70233|nr:hypothetical protein [Evansella halocellulosilytica]
MDGLLLREKSKGRPIEIMYMSTKGLVTKRTVSVIKVNKQSLYGYCHLRNEVRHFKKENILAVLPKTTLKRNQSMF